MYFTAPNLPFLRSSGASPKARQQVGTPRGRRIQAARAREERERDRERERLGRPGAVNKLRTSTQFVSQIYLRAAASSAGPRNF